MRLLLISGSLRGGSTNTAVLRTARDVAPPGVETTLYTGMSSLPHFNPDDDAEGRRVDLAVADLRTHVSVADAVLLCTPEYAGALPGALKNLLEWTIGDGGLSATPVGWINASGPAAPSDGTDAHESLAKVLGYANADIIERACVRIPLTRDAVGPDGLISASGPRRQIVEAVTALVAEFERRQRADAPEPTGLG